MDPLIRDHLLDRDVGLAERGVGPILVTHLPGEDVVVVLARAVRAFGLAREIVAQHRGVRRHRLEGVDVAGQPLVFDLDQVGAVRGGVAVVRDHESDFLVLVEHLLLGEHGLHVAGERRHVVQVERLQIGCGEHREHARNRLGLTGVDVLDARVRVRRPCEVAVEHARQFQVVDVIAFALDEADILDALALAAHSLELFGALGGGGGRVGHSAASWNGTPLSLAAAY